MALVSVRATCSCPTSSLNRWGRYLRASTKYDMAAYQKDHVLHGLYGTGYGVWAVLANKESWGGGPTRQDLTLHQTDTTPLLLKFETMLFEISGIDEAVAKRCLARVAHKLPVKCRFVTRRPNV